MLLDPDNGLLITLAKGLLAKQWRCAVQLLWTLVCLSLLLAACGRTLAQPAIQDEDGAHVSVTYGNEVDLGVASVYSLTDLVDGLRVLGLTVVTTERPVDHGFVIEGVRVLVEDIPVFVYEFEEATAAQTAAAGVSTDAYSVTISRAEGEMTHVHHSDWLEMPHVYLKGRVIVLTGDDPLVVDALDTLLGPPLASGSPR
jgi:hypothetical protein